MTDPRKKWLKDNPNELPSLVDEEARSMGADTSNPEMRAMIRELIEMDPDLFGDFDAFE